MLHRRQPFSLVRLDLAFAGGSLGRKDLVTIIKACPLVRFLKLTALRWKISWVRESPPLRLRRARLTELLISQPQLVEVFAAIDLETLEIDYPLGAKGSTVTSCGAESVQVERRTSFKSVAPPVSQAFHPGDDVLSLMST